jgi:hypothetical protein
MIIQPLPDLFFLLEEPPFTAPDEILVLGASPSAVEVAMPAAAKPVPGIIGAAEPDAAPPSSDAAPESLLAAEPTPVPDVATAEPASPPAFDVPPEDAFPSLADLDAILAANAGPPPGPDLAEREALLALLGLDPAIAADPDLYDATIAALPEPDADQVLADWMNEAGVGDPPPEWPAFTGDWLLV